MSDYSSSLISDTDASNTNAVPNGWPSSTTPSQVVALGQASLGASKRLWLRGGPAVTTTGSANAYALVYPNTVYPAALVQGDTYSFIASFANTGATTLNVNALGAVVVKKPGTSGPTALTGGEIQIGQVVKVGYDGTSFHLMTPLPSTSSNIPLSALATQANNTVVGNNSGSTASPSALTASQVLSMIGGTQGQILYCSAANTWSALAPGTSGQFLKTSGAAANPSWANATTGIGKVSAQVFTSSGTYTPTSGMTYCIVEMVGGGGGGAGAGTAGASAGGGGGAGGYIRALLTAAQVGASKTITIGAAGTAGGSGTAGGNGGTTSVASLLSCTGGNGATGANGNTGGAPTVTTGTNILSVTGQTGGASCTSGSSGLISGCGGSNPLGFGGAGLNPTASHIAGVAGVGFGAGGSGGAYIDATNTVGGAGTAGYVAITEYQ